MNTTRFVACLPEAWLDYLQTLAASPREDSAVEPEPIARLENDVLHVTVQGIILPTRYGSAPCTPCDEIMQALDSGNFSRIILHVDSPGGVAQGVDQVHARLMDLRADGIDIEARVSGLCASAAYWLASAADRILVRPTSEVGGIGVYRVYYDRSEALREAGVRPVVVRSGPHKAIGVDAITDDQEAVELQNIMDIHNEFLRAVSAGRGMDPADVAVLATGRTYVGRRAVLVGLADDIEKNFTTEEVDDMADEIVEKAAAVEPAEEAEACVDTVAGNAEPEAVAEDTVSAASETADPVQVERDRVAALLETFADDAAFASACVRDGLTLDQAKAKWFDERRGSTAAARVSVEPVEPVAVLDDVASARETVRRMAAEQGIPLSRAWAQYWRENNIIR